MYRFKDRFSLKSIFGSVQFSVVIFIAIFVFFLYMLGNISEDTKARQEESLNSAVHRCIVSCYCVEGTYPPSLDYMVQHYGLTYDKSSFFIDYRPEGANIYPEVAIIRKGERHE